MKILFMGTPDFTIPILDAMEAAGHRLVAVVTQPDRPVGRKQILTAPPAKEWAVSHGVPVLQPERVRESEAIAQLKEYDADIYVVAAFGQILPKEVLELPPFGCINIHASLLPKYRGASPIQWSILNGDLTTGVTIMQMGEGLDDGDILLQKEIHIAPEDTGGSLFDKLAKLGGEAVCEALPKVAAGELVPVPQDESQATKVGKIEKSLGQLSLSRPAVELVRYIRGLSPWPGTTIPFHGKRLKVLDAEAMTEQEIAECGNFRVEDIHGKAGETVLAVGEDWILRTGEGFLVLRRVQPEGKRPMSVGEFLRGARH